MRYGLNVSGDVETLRLVGRQRFTIIRPGLHTVTHGAAVAYLENIYDAGLTALPIVRDGGQVWSLGSLLNGTDVELWNEPDGHVDRYISPQEYAAMVPSFVEACRGVGARPWIGAISNLHRNGLTWLDRMWAALPPHTDLTGVGVSAHWYPYGRLRTNPHPGFNSRESAVTKFRSIIGLDRPWGISEFGFHTAPQLKIKQLPRWFPGNTWRWNDEQVRSMVAAEWAFWNAEGAEFAVLYQLNDGRDRNAAEHCFGIRRFDTFDGWKPVAHTVPA